MVVDMRFLGVLQLFGVLVVVMAVGERAVVVLMRMPVGAVLPLGEQPPAMVMGDVVMIVGMGARRVGMLRFFAFALSALRCLGHHCLPGRHTLPRPACPPLVDAPATA